MELLANRSVGRSRALRLTAISLGFLMITLDATIVNVALGPIGTDLGGALSTAQWIVNGYTLAFAALLLSAGALADRLGSRTGFLIGLAVFGLGSAACACATSLTALIVARVIQGTGAAALMPCSLALIAHAFPDPRDRRRALGVWGGVSGIGLAAGPVLGGILIAALGWRAIFLVNLPIAAAAGALLRRHAGETPRHRHPLDLPGQILAAAGLAALTGGFIIAGSRGSNGSLTLALLVARNRERGRVRGRRTDTVDHPMVDPALFRERAFSIAIALGVTFNFCLYGSIFCLAIDLHRAHGLRRTADRSGPASHDPRHGLDGVPEWPSGRPHRRMERHRRRPDRRRRRGAAHFDRRNRRGNDADRVERAPGVSALAMPAMTAVAMSHAPRHRIGLASGGFNASRQTGGALGVAVLGALLAGRSGYVSLHAAFLAIAGAYAGGVALALIRPNGDA